MASPSDVSQPTGSLRGGFASMRQPAIEAGRVRGFSWTDRFGHWGTRIPVAAVLINQGLLKFLDVFLAPVTTACQRRSLSSQHSPRFSGPWPCFSVALYDVHVVLLGITVYFALRGNKYGALDKA
ncbi:MAG: hypothetical protein AAGI10_03830 [Pseudomonadota bacterium]